MSYTPGDEYLRPQVGVERTGLRWRWSVCIENRIDITGMACTRRGAARRARRLLAHTRVWPRARIEPS